MESLDELLTQVTPATSRLIREQLVPALFNFRSLLDEAALERTLHGALERIKGIYVDIVTQQAVDTIRPENQEALATIMKMSAQQRDTAIFGGFYRAIEVAYQGNPTSKSRALELINTEIGYLLEGLLPKKA